MVMSPRILPKTLVKTLSYVACHAPSEYGLFWDQEGTMPWKELYWALQEDPQLRFVRESTVTELELVGLELPFTLQDGRLSIKDRDELPSYEPCLPPDTLYYWARTKQVHAIMQNGLAPDGQRSYLPLFADRDMANRVARRRDPKPVQVTVSARRAHQAGISFLNAGAEMYLCTRIPTDFLEFPPLSEQVLSNIAATRKKEPKAPKKIAKAPSPGSFYLETSHLARFSNEEEPPAHSRKQKKRGKGPDWKRESRKERRKRDIDNA